MDDAVTVLGLDLPINFDMEFVERSIGGEDVADIAERILMVGEAYIRRNIDAPVHHILAVVIARGQPQHTWTTQAGGS